MDDIQDGILLAFLLGHLGWKVVGLVFAVG
jgi:hypothetical protein